MPVFKFTEHIKEIIDDIGVGDVHINKFIIDLIMSNKVGFEYFGIKLQETYCLIFVKQFRRN